MITLLYSPRFYRVAGWICGAGAVVAVLSTVLLTVLSQQQLVGDVGLDYLIDEMGIFQVVVRPAVNTMGLMAASLLKPIVAMVACLLWARHLMAH